MLLLNEDDQVPLIFHLCTNYFRQNNSQKMLVEGLFRVGGSPEKLKELELHMSVGNYGYINTVQSPHVVSNYLKRVLFELKDPLIPFRQYDEYGQLGHYEGEEKIRQIKRLVDDMDTQRQQTLKFLVQFFREVVSNEKSNKMTSYNIAVTTCPTIIRPKVTKPDDLFKHATYYAALIKMIEYYDVIFEGNKVEDHKKDNFRHGEVGTVGCKQSATSTSASSYTKQEVLPFEEDLIQQMQKADINA